jgi:predicted Fe-S protein YdhL (DUF1289 family)
VSAPARAGDEVPSPCISVCRIMPASGLCAGCFRTLDEIAAWSVLDAAGKRAVLAALAARRAAHADEPTLKQANARAER